MFQYVSERREYRCRSGRPSTSVGRYCGKMVRQLELWKASFLQLRGAAVRALSRGACIPVAACNSSGVGHGRRL